MTRLHTHMKIRGKICGEKVIFRMFWIWVWLVSMEKKKTKKSASESKLNETEIEMAQFSRDANGRAQNDKWAEHSIDKALSHIY